MGVLGEIERGNDNLSTAGREGDLDLSSISVSSLTCGVLPERARLLLYLPRSPPLPEDEVSEVGCEVSESSSLPELPLPPPIAGIACLPKVTAESADSEVLGIVCIET